MILLNRYSSTAIFFLLFSGSLYAQTFEFVENKGQWHQDVQFKGELNGGAFFLKKSGYRALQHHSSDFEAAMAFFTGHSHAQEGERNPKMLSAGKPLEPAGEDGPMVRSHAYDMIFEGANPNPQILPEREMVGYSNYFIGNDPAKWKSGVKTFGAVRYVSLYPGIDVRFFSENGYLKYDIIVSPTANAAQIGLRYDGASVSVQKNGELLVKTSVSDIREREPYTYQVQNGKRTQIDCKYVVTGNLVTFKLGNYDRNSTLVIDPTLIFSTFTGSTVDNWGYTATFDGFGNAYGGGVVFGNGFPTTVGAFQGNFGGGGNTGEGSGFDMGLMKLNPTGTQRLYSTYLGGGGNEQPHSLVVDGLGNLIVAGRTTSINYPVIGNNVVGPGGSWDIVVTKFNPQGSILIGSIEIGGTDNDGVNIKHKTTSPTGPRSLFQNYGDDARSEVITDRSGNIFLASCTNSTDFPATAGAFQTGLKGTQDALLLKFNPTVGLVFASLFGGTADDAAYVIEVEDDDHILLAGGTTSTDFPGILPNSLGPTYHGGLIDGFVTRFERTGGSILGSVYIGTGGVDQIYGLQKDRNNFVYVSGTSSGNFIVRNAAFSQTGGKQFIAKLANDFSTFVYSTVFGPNTINPNLSPTAFLVDRCENVYVSGWGGQMGGSIPYPNNGTTGLTVTPDAIDQITDGKDFYFFVMEQNATRQLYGTFFGQQDLPNSGTPDHVDGGTSRFDPTGAIYQGICANCSPGQFPTTPGVVAPSKPPSATCNLAVIKIAFDLSGVISGIKSSIDGVDGDTSACSPTLVNFRDTIGMAKTYRWLFGDGTPEITTVLPETSHSFAVAGTYRVRLIAVDDARCFPRDTSFVNIRVRTDRVTVSAQAIKVDPCQSNTYRFQNLSTIIPNKPFKDTSFTWNFGDNSPLVKSARTDVVHQFPAPGTYNIQLILTDTNYCNAPDTFRIQLRVSPTVIAAFDIQSPGCAPYLAKFANTSAGGQTFAWTFGNGQTSAAINPTTVYATPGNYAVRLIAIDPNTCNVRDTIIKTVVVLPKPAARFTFSPNPSEENIPTAFTNLSDPATRYKWLFGDGDSLITIRRDTLVKHQYLQTGVYNACLITVNDIGCSDTLCRSIQASVNPLVEVVTAFTPNKDGKNDFAVVIGFGVSKMTFRIFNRWGQLVFESNDPKIGWDGRFNGADQPIDVYGYTLDAELLTGEKLKKSGSITLVR
jgi:gliding motility-associated-like protein